MQTRKELHTFGKVLSKTFSAMGEPAAYQVRMHTDSGVLTLKWLGRRDVPGIDLGVSLEVSGIAVNENGVLTIINPDYRLVQIS